MDQKKNSIVKEDEIDLVELTKVIWSRKWFISKIAFVFLALGGLLAFTTPNYYKSSCTLIPESISNEGQISGSLGGLASMAGIDLGGMNDGGSTINPGLYRSIAKSTPFLLELLNTKFYVKSVNQEVTLYDYFKNHRKSSLTSKIVNAPLLLVDWARSRLSTSSDGPEHIEQIGITMTQEEMKMILSLKELVGVTMDWELNVVYIEVQMPEPNLTAQVAKFTLEYITKYVKEYSTSKSVEQLKYIEVQYLEKKQEFEQAQIELARFQDKNQYTNTSIAKSEEQRLQSEYNIKYNVFNQLAQQREQYRLKVNEAMPVFTVLEPVIVPVKKDGPKRLLMLLVFTFFGLFFGAVFSLVSTNSIFRKSTI